MSTTPLMKCGHAANAKDSNGQDVCVICGTAEQAPAPDLTGRMARCTYYPNGGKYYKCPPPVESSTRLAFFSHQPNQAFDTYFCGCWGWD